MNQLILLLDLEVKLQENDIAFFIHHLVEGIPIIRFEQISRVLSVNSKSMNVKTVRVAHYVSYVRK